jgi:large subunit ribosomal protein L23
MKDIYQVIKGPLITEKSTILKEGQNKYCFVVDKRANKAEIKEAVEKIFNVKVADVNTMNFKGKVVRYRMHYGKKPDWKKAIVTIKEGSIDIFEGV